MHFPMPCPRCHTVLQVTAADSGRQITCGCGQQILVPQAPAMMPPQMMPMQPMPPPSSGGMGWAVMGVVVVVLLAICGGGGFAAYTFFSGAMNQARAAASRVAAQNNAKQIMLAIHNFNTREKYVPKSAITDPSGKPLLSWRVKLLPYIDSGNLYSRFHLDEPWDSPHNRALINEMPVVFGNPPLQLPPGHTCWQAVVGERSMIARHSETRAGGAPLEGVDMAMVRDGLSNTIAIVEVDPDRAVIWTKPDDFEYDPNNPVRGLGNMRPGGFIAGFGDGSVRSIPAIGDPEQFRRAFDRSDGQPTNLP